MNNTLGYPGLAYSHSGYVPHHISSDQNHDNSVSANIPSTVTSLSKNPVSRYSSQGTPMTSVPSHSTVPLPPKRDKNTTSLHSSMYATRPVYVNPYMNQSIPSPHAHIQSAAMYHPHMHPHAFIAPPPAFSMQASSKPQQHTNMIQSPSSIDGFKSNVAVETSYASYVPYASNALVPCNGGPYRLPAYSPATSHGPYQVITCVLGYKYL